MSWEWVTEVYDCKCGDGEFYEVSGENDWFQHEDYSYGGCSKCNTKGQLIRKVFSREGKHYYEEQMTCPQCGKESYPIIHIGKHKDSFTCPGCNHQFER